MIPESAHIRRASIPENLLRRPFNFDDGFTADGIADHGLLFIAFCAELSQYLKIQSRLAEYDALNRWTTPVGSALFAVLPGVSEGQWLGQSLLEG